MDKEHKTAKKIRVQLRWRLIPVNALKMLSYKVARRSHHGGFVAMGLIPECGSLWNPGANALPQHILYLVGIDSFAMDGRFTDFINTEGNER